MNRRAFLKRTAAAATWMAQRGGAMGSGAGAAQAALTLDGMKSATEIPTDFTGLSYESAQLTNADLFSGKNGALIALFRELGTQGVLRLGGGTSDFTVFSAEENAAPAGAGAARTATGKNAKREMAITLRSLRNLRAFLDATGWRCLYGLNLGRGTVADAAEEALQAQAILGPRLIAFQLGNEPDAWRNRYRPPTWSYGDYWKEWSTAHAAIVARVPQAKFAGPDAATRMEYVTGLAQDAKKSRAEVVLLTWHYYAMGPAGAKGVTLERMLTMDPRLTQNLQQAAEAARELEVPFRISEMNSCWNGGQHGASDVLASALWVVDAMMQCAARGCAGVNLHGGGNGHYTPIAGSMAQGFERRPVYYGMKLFSALAGARVLATSLISSESGVNACMAEHGEQRYLAAVNKSDRTLQMGVPMRNARWQTVLRGKAIGSADDVGLWREPAHLLRHGTLQLAPFQAVLLEA